MDLPEPLVHTFEAFVDPLETFSGDLLGLVETFIDAPLGVVGTFVDPREAVVHPPPIL